jgi:hypothetical protein
MVVQVALKPPHWISVWFFITNLVVTGTHSASSFGEKPRPV